MRFNPGCACCPGAQDCFPDAVGGCEAVAEQYEIDGFLPDSSLPINLYFFDTTCKWETIGGYAMGSVCNAAFCGGNLFARLWYNASGPYTGFFVLELTIISNGAIVCDAIYKKSAASWSCLGTNTLDFDSEAEYECQCPGFDQPPANCPTWPATLDVVPV